MPRGARRESWIEQGGFILLCTARPRSPIRIQIHQRDVMRAYRLKAGLPPPRG